MKKIKIKALKNKKRIKSLLEITFFKESPEKYRRIKENYC
tara:strand:+ start:258 stop:377 length:120 start_codon:yes stop_codon:yes gene_type:complete